MKKLILGGAVLLAMACSKENTEATKTNPMKKTSYSYLETEYEAPEDKESVITSFLEDYASETLSEMPVDDAIWTLEAAINYDNRYTPYGFDSTYITTDEFIYDLSDEEVEGNDLEDFYHEIENMVANATTTSNEYLVTNVGVNSLSGSQVRFFVEVVVAFAPDPVCPRDITANDLAADVYANCIGGPGHEPEAWVVAKNAHGQWLNRLYAPCYSEVYGDGVLHFGTNGSLSLSNDLLWGGSNAVITSDQGLQTNINGCMSMGDQDTYRNAVYNQVSSLGDIVSIYIQPDFNHVAGVDWVYKDVFIAYQNLKSL